MLFALNTFFVNVVFAPAPPKSVVIPYNVFLQQVSVGNIVSVTSTSNAITGTSKKPVSAAVGQEGATHFSTERPGFASDDLVTLLQKHSVTINAQPPNPPAPLWQTLLISFGPVLLIVAGSCTWP